MPIRKGTATSSRNKRVTVEIDLTTHSRLKQESKATRISLKELCARAIKDAVEPPWTFHDPKPRVYCLSEFLEGAKEIILVGPVLAYLLHEREFLERIIMRDKTPVTVVMVNPDIEDVEDGKYKYVLQLLEERNRYKFPRPAGVKAKLQEVAAFLNELKETGKQSGTQVKVLYTKSLPMCGLAVKDPRSPNAEMSVALYLHTAPAPDARDPFIVLRRCAATNAAYERLMTHYVELAEEAEYAPDCAYDERDA